MKKQFLQFIPLMMPVAFGISLSGCKKTPTTQQYQSKYKEYELVGEWVYKDTRTLRKYHYDIDYTILLILHSNIVFSEPFPPFGKRFHSPGAFLSVVLP